MLIKLIAAAFVLMFLVSLATSQSTSLPGIVTDQNGAVVPNDAPFTNDTLGQSLPGVIGSLCPDRSNRGVRSDT